MTVKLYLHEPLMSELDVCQHHNRGKPMVGEHHSPYGSSRRVKTSLSTARIWTWFLPTLCRMSYLQKYICIQQMRLLVNDQRDAQIPFYVFIFLFITLYMFRAHRAHHQEGQIISIQPLVTVTLCWWPCRVQVMSTMCSKHVESYK